MNTVKLTSKYLLIGIILCATIGYAESSSMPGQFSGSSAVQLGSNAESTYCITNTKCFDPSVIGAIIDIDQSLLSGSGVDNGTGIVESYFANALLLMDEIITYALSQNQGFSDQEIALLNRIKSSLPMELKTRPLLIFKPGGQSFIIDGLLRVAYTKLHVGAKIYIDRSQIYQEIQGKLIPSLSESTAIQILLHELGHHHGETDHDYLSELGASVAKAWQGQSRPSGVQNGSFETSQQNWPSMWFPGWSQYTLTTIDRINSAKGTGSLVFYSLSPYGQASVYQCKEFEADKYRQLRVSALLMPNLGYNSYGALAAYVFNSQGQLESYTDGFNYYSFGQSQPYYSLASGVGPWSYKAVSFFLSPNSKSLCISLYQAGSGYFWVDDVSIDFFEKL